MNAIVLWNTTYMEEILKQLRLDGFPVLESDEARLSPLISSHFNTLGKYLFSIPDFVTKGNLRPLRDPNDDGGGVFD
jgi:hypothetical protein